MRNDAASSKDELRARIEEENEMGGIRCIDGIVISPGPGRPERSGDIGICLEVRLFIILSSIGFAWVQFAKWPWTSALALA